MEDNDEYRLVGKDSLVYTPSKVSWSVSEHIAKENPWISRLLLYFIVFSFIAVAIYSVFSTVAVSIKATGALGYASSNIEVINKNDMVIKKIFVSDGQEIKENDKLILTESQITKKDLKALKSDRAIANKVLSFSLQGKCRGSCIRLLEDLDQKGFTFNPKIKVSGNLKDYLNNLSRDVKSFTQVVKESTSRGATNSIDNKIRVLNEKIKKIERQKSQNLLKSEYENLKSDLRAAISQKREQLSNERRQSTSKVLQSRNNLSLNLKKLPIVIKNFISGNRMKAPKRGIIKFKKEITSGQFVSARTPLFEILPVGEKYIAKLKLATKDISKIKKGMKVKINVTALPEREFETLWGIVQKIPLESNSDPKTGTNFYEVLVKLDKQYLYSRDGNKNYFKSGMDFEAKMIVAYESLFRSILKKLLNIRDEYLGS